MRTSVRKGIIEKASKEESERWNGVLANEGLAVDRGRSRKLVYVGDSQNLDVIQVYQELDASGRRRSESLED